MGIENRQLAILVMQSQACTSAHPARFTLLACVLLVCLPANAKTGDTVQPYLYYNFTQDNNLFRSSVNEQSDTYNQLGAGGLIDWNQGRQEIVGRISANTTKFAKNTILDYSGFDMLGQWNWQLGNHLAGQLGYTSSRTLGSFLDYNGALAQNTVDRSTKFFNVSYLFHPRWRINAVLDTETLSYSAPGQKANEHTVDHLELGGDYLTPKGSKLGIYAARWNGDYPNKQPFLIPMPFPFPPFVIAVDNSYTQDEIGIRSNWRVDDKLQLSARAGQTRRKHKEMSQRDFSGLTGRVDVSWQATGKMEIDGALYREIGAVTNTAASSITDIYASYVVNNGVRISPTWLISEKLKLSGSLYTEANHFEGDPFSLGKPRKDRSDGYSLSMNYQPRAWASLSLSYQGQRRSSNLPGFDFSDQSLNLSAQLVF